MYILFLYQKILIKIFKLLILRPRHKIYLQVPGQAGGGNFPKINDLQFEDNLSRLCPSLDKRIFFSETRRKVFTPLHTKKNTYVPKWRKSANKSIAQLSCSHSLQDDFRDPAAKNNSIINTAAARSNLDAAITMRSAETELQNTIKLRATASEIISSARPRKNLKSSKHYGNDPTITNHNGILSTAHVRKTVEKSHLQCGTDPAAQPSHRRAKSSRFGDELYIEKHRFYVSTISQQRFLCETSFKTPSATPPPVPLAMPFKLRERFYSYKLQRNSIGNSSTSTTYNPIYITGTIL